MSRSDYALSEAPVRSRDLTTDHATGGVARADDAVSALYAEHRRELVGLALALLRDQAAAEDVVQDAFVALHARWHRLEDHGAAVGYLHRCVVNGARTAHRRRSTVVRYLARAEPPPDEPPADRRLVADEQRDEVLAALAELPTRQREVLSLRYFRDLSEVQIADALGISPGSVKTHASRGAQTLRRLLAPAQEDLR